MGISTPCLIAQCSPDFSFHTSSYTTDCLRRVIVGLLAAVNWTEECLMITLTYWPEFSCLDHRAHHFPRSSDDHLIFGNGDHWLPPSTPTVHIPKEVISPPGKMPFGLRLFSMGSKPKMFGPFLFFDGKIPLIYHKRLFWGSQNERVSWPITSISFNGVFQRQSHSTSFKWYVGKEKEKEIAFMECLLCVGPITLIESWGLHNNPWKYILLYLIL